MNDAKVVAACIASREAYEAVAAHIRPDADLSPSAALWWPLVVAWYAADGSAKCVDAVSLRERGREALPAQHTHALLEWLDALEFPVSPVNAAQDLLSLKRRAAQQEHLAAVSEGDVDRAAATWAVYSELALATDLNARATLQLYDPAEAMSDHRPGTGIRVPPVALGNALGPLGPGDTVVLYGRPNMAKSLFALAAATDAARAGHRVLYVGNEEPISRLVLRAITRICARPTFSVKENFERALAYARRHGMDNIAWAHLEPGTPTEIEALCRAVRPNLLIVDQIRNIEMKTDRMAEKLEKVQQAIRAYASRYQFAAISLTQAGDEADGQRVLRMGHIADCNTGVQGACDAMVGIGADDGMLHTGMRVVSLPKNKLGLVEDHFPVSVNLELQTFVEDDRV